MPEAFAILFVFVVVVAAYAGARVHAANPLNHNPAAEVSRLQQHRVWLEERLQQAGRENWEPAMRQRIADDLQATKAELTRTVSAR